MLEGYFDESGTHQGSTVCTLAGYFGGERHWKRFDGQWRGILNRYKVAEFHAKRFWARDANGDRVDEYKQWSNQRCEQFLSELLRTIASNRVYPVAAAVEVAEWQKLTNDERRYATGGVYDRGKFRIGGAPGKTYFLPFLFCIRKVATYCHDGNKTHFFFDRNNSYTGYALQYYKLLSKLELKCSTKLGDIAFPESITATPIQAADLLAYQTHRYAKEKIANRESLLEISEVLNRATRRIKSLNNDAKIFDKRGLDLLLEKFREARYGELNGERANGVPKVRFRDEKNPRGIQSRVTKTREAISAKTRAEKAG